MAKISADLQAIPGVDLVERGIEDLRHERDSIEALLVSIGSLRLGSRFPLQLHRPSTSSTPCWPGRRRTPSAGMPRTLKMYAR